MSCTMQRTIDEHFAGTVRAEAERAMRAHLPGCEPCHAQYRRHLLLAKLDPEALPAEERIARGLGLRVSPKGSQRAGQSVIRRLGPALAVVTTMAAAAMWLLSVRSAPVQGDFAARGHVATTAASRVLVYEVKAGAAPALAGTAVARGAELAFAYENAAARQRLLVFGVDEHDHVYWFFPAWTDDATNPVAIPIERDSDRHELPEAIRHRFDGARLEIHSVFVDEPVSVKQVEALLRQAGPSAPARPLPIAGAIETVTPLQVTP